MQLTKGSLFHNRYLLVGMLGQGASAEVWRARDTKADNLLVAIKIFSENTGMDSYGMRDFQREFTTVYNMNHSNLLPPTGYDVCEGRPYLVMQYCENGSCSSMAGRVEEDDVIRFLHDVSAGLEYLHDHNIIHQDIKPDNILVDDNCNFIVTDFGISVNSANDDTGDSGMSGGTRAYMGPERFDGITTSASDMWSLGATVVELITGTPPYGEHGGLLQAQGEPLPELPESFGPEVRRMILSCLAADPQKRITASEIRQKTELYRETGSWTKHSHKNTIAIAATALVSVIVCLAIWLWDYNRTKVFYYKDYAEYWGIPKGIGRVSGRTVKHREHTYKMEFKRGKLRRLTLVNSCGMVVDHNDTEDRAVRFADVTYFYNAEGRIDYKCVYDTQGRMLFKMDYDEDKSVTFRQNDEHGTEINLRSNINELYSEVGLYEQRSNISRYLLTYDEDGLMTECRYAGLQNVPASDKNKIYGKRYKYDSKGRRVEETFIGYDGSIACDGNGLAVKQYTFDEDDNWTSVRYLNAEGEGSHDGQNCSLVKLEYDDYGNRCKETYFTIDEKPSLRADYGVHGFAYLYNDEGCRVEQRCLGTDGQTAYSSYGFAVMRDSFDTNGFSVQQDFLDENMMPATYNDMSGDVFSRVVFVNTATGLPLERRIYDEQGKPVETADGIWKTESVYDSLGLKNEERYYGADGKLGAVGGFYSAVKLEYDEHQNLTSIKYLDKDAKASTCDGQTAEVRMEYNRQGQVLKQSYWGKDGKPTGGPELYASVAYEYDPASGNKTEERYFSVDGKPTVGRGKHARKVYVYDEKSNQCVKEKYYDANGNLLYVSNYKYDSRGHMTEQYEADATGRMKSGTAVWRAEYDANGNITNAWYCNLDGAKVNMPGATYSVIRSEYDRRGNCTVRSYWTTQGTPAVDENNTHKRVQEFDMMNRVVHELNYGKDGKPLSGSTVNPEGRRKYDQWGNVIELACYDGYGKPRLSSDGFFTNRMTYDKRRKIIHDEYVGTDGGLVMSKSSSYAKADFAYNNHGDLTEAKHYDTNSKCIRIEKHKYNEKNQEVEMLFCDGNGKPSDKEYGCSKITIEYDKTTSVPTMRKFYSVAGKLLGTSSWNGQKGEWNSIKVTGGGQSVNYSSSSGDWRSIVTDANRNCPLDLADGVKLSSITASGNSVTAIVRLANISKYEMTEEQMTAAENIVASLKSMLKKSLGLPLGVSVAVYVVDKEGKMVV